MCLWFEGWLKKLKICLLSNWIKSEEEILIPFNYARTFQFHLSSPSYKAFFFVTSPCCLFLYCCSVVSFISTLRIYHEKMILIVWQNLIKAKNLFFPHIVSVMLLFQFGYVCLERRKKAIKFPFGETCNSRPLFVVPHHECILQHRKMRI